MGQEINLRRAASFTYCYPHTPDDFRLVVTNEESLAKWCKEQKIPRLIEALGWVYPRYTHLRDVIDNEISNRNHNELVDCVRELKKPHWTVLWTFGLVIAGLVVGIISVVIAWLAWRKPVPPPSNDLSTQRAMPPVVPVPIAPNQIITGPTPIPASPSPAQTKAVEFVPNPSVSQK
jgi:hypothetical protein